MKTILITGGTGGLGSAVADLARTGGHHVRIMSRRPAPTGLPPNTEWAQADVLTGDGLRAALDGVDTVIHAATALTSRYWETEVEGTQRMVDAAKAARTPHFIYVSIVGIDRIPDPHGKTRAPLITTDPARVPFFYYRAKLAAERVIAASGIDHSILRASQFHSLLDTFLGMLLRSPVGLLPADFRAQPISTRDAARAFVRLAEGTAQGRSLDIGGPEVLTWEQMARAWVSARGLRRVWLPVYPPGRIAAVFRRGYITCPDACYGTQTWESWLRERYARRVDDDRYPVREA